MKIKNIDKESKNNSKNYLAIARAGLSLGLITALITTGMIDYDELLNWESISEALENLHFNDFPFANQAYDLAKNAVTTFGMNTIVIAIKAFNLTKEFIKPILESEKVKNNPTILKIKEILKGKNKNENKDENKDKEAKPRALVNLAKKGLSLGFTIYMILSGQIDYNSVYDLTKISHKFVKIGQIAQNIDLNTVKIAMQTFFNILPEFIVERRQEKKEGMQLMPKISFKELLQKYIFKYFPRSIKIENLEDIGPNMQSTEPIISDSKKVQSEIAD